MTTTFTTLHNIYKMLLAYLFVATPKENIFSTLPHLRFAATIAIRVHTIESLSINLYVYTCLSLVSGINKYRTMENIYGQHPQIFE